MAFGQSEEQHDSILRKQRFDSIEKTFIWSEGKIDKDTTRFNIKERRAFYPFNVAKQVKLVSFNVLDYGLPTTKKSVNVSKLHQVISLKQPEIDSLTDILYNTRARYYILKMSTSGCYDPHNAVLFFDKNNKVFEYIEICFDCHQVRYSNEKVVVFDDCVYTFDDLKSYFQTFELKTSKKEFEKK